MKQSNRGFKTEECWECEYFKKGNIFTGNKCTRYANAIPKRISPRDWCAFWEKRIPVVDDVPDWMLTSD